MPNWIPLRAPSPRRARSGRPKLSSSRTGPCWNKRPNPVEADGWVSSLNDCRPSGLAAGVRGCVPHWQRTWAQLRQLPRVQEAVQLERPLGPPRNRRHDTEAGRPVSVAAKRVVCKVSCMSAMWRPRTLLLGAEAVEAEHAHTRRATEHKSVAQACRAPVERAQEAAASGKRPCLRG